jgi:hypothetical protein
MTPQGSEPRIDRRPVIRSRREGPWNNSRSSEGTMARGRRESLSVEAFTSEQERLLDAYRRTWTDALILEGHDTLRASLLSELGTYMSARTPPRSRCGGARAVALLKGEWQAKVIPSSRHSIEQFYDESQNTIYELM